MTSSVVRARLAATVSLVALSLATPALAQSAQEQAATVDDIIVTAQKREESIQDVPIAVSAFSSEMLDALKIEGGSELLRAVPNVAFSKNNFSMYNFSIRGVGTKAISSTSDPAVAISFNNAPMIRNRLFESEYLDVKRVEVLRGPQGTLYGRNATGGVVNMIPNIAGPDFDAYLKAEIGNFESKRGQMMVNVPLSDTFFFRAAASVTQREGFDKNEFTGEAVNGRDLYSTRLSLAWEPTDRVKTSLIWEHFGESDDRSRTGKSLCTRDPGPAQIGSTSVPVNLRNRLSQGCQAKSLYTDDAYGTPNMSSLAYMYMVSQISTGAVVPGTVSNLLIIPANIDPFANANIYRDMRTYDMAYDPKFEASNHIVQFNVDVDLTDNVRFTSQTTYTKDSYFSTQDYLRNLSDPIINRIDGAADRLNRPINQTITIDGLYYDPQLGSSNRMLSADISQSENDQFTQEFRLASSFDGFFNFSVGANYLKFNTLDDYYVFNNMFNIIAEYWYNRQVGAARTLLTSQCTSAVTKECVYVDYSPMGELAGDGRNYFRSKNDVETESWSVFGEFYWKLADNLKLTTALRYTDDTKITTPYPSQLLLGADSTGIGWVTGGKTRRGYSALPDIEQNWSAVTGRVVLDWKPELSFTDETLVYASYASGYKGGGTNPPRMDLNTDVIQYLPLATEFDPEYVDAFEIGMKNTLLDGALRLNLSGFYYDYSDYQVSQIVDRISLNENFDAEMYGVELEAIYQPNRHWRFDLNIGHLKTRIGDGEKSVDVMNRTQGNPDWVLVRPWIQVPSNCIAPRKHVEAILKSPLASAMGVTALGALCAGSVRTGTYNPDYSPSYFPVGLYDLFGFTYDNLTEAPNAGRGFDADLSGNEMPNAPNWTANLGIEHIWYSGAWQVSVRADQYWQSSSYFRVYNTEFDALKSWDNTNLMFVFAKPETGLTISAYVKNVFDKAPIVDAFVNSDDTGLSTNVFSLDPRVYGFTMSKRF